MNSTHRSKVKQIKFHKLDVLKDSENETLNAILNSERCQSLINQCREFRVRAYSPLTTLFLFIQQVFHPDKSCRNAVAGYAATQAIKGEIIHSSNTGPYCKARQRLPESTVQSLVTEVGTATERSAKKGWHWRDHNIKLVDGTTASMPDTEANQNKFPQHGKQEEGVGFPLLRIVVVMSLAVGTIIDYAVDAYKGKGTGEHSLFRRIMDCINVKDILLGDRYYPCFFLLADLTRRGADGVFHGQAQRKYDFRKGQSLGKKEHLIFWKKPPKPTWMEQGVYDACPNEIKVREFKVNGKVYVTTLLNHKKYNKNELAKLYDLRWQVEINLGAIKTTLKMDQLSCKTPDMVFKEIGIHFLGYNIIRNIMAQSCKDYNKIPNQVSFKGALQLINQFMPHFQNGCIAKNAEMYRELLRLISVNEIGKRPGRIEPRVVKKRRKPFPLLKKPRGIVRNKLIRKISRKRNSKTAAA